MMAGTSECPNIMCEGIYENNIIFIAEIVVNGRCPHIRMN
jgi:hypothetical protein